MWSPMMRRINGYMERKMKMRINELINGEINEEKIKWLYDLDGPVDRMKNRRRDGTK